MKLQKKKEKTFLKFFKIKVNMLIKKSIFLEKIVSILQKKTLFILLPKKKIRKLFINISQLTIMK
jgi:hypothetical protein